VGSTEGSREAVLRFHERSRRFTGEQLEGGRNVSAFRIGESRVESCPDEAGVARVLDEEKKQVEAGMGLCEIPPVVVLGPWTLKHGCQLRWQVGSAVRRKYWKDISL
jgi:hypothetical protein